MIRFIDHLLIGVMILIAVVAVIPTALEWRWSASEQEVRDQFRFEDYLEVYSVTIEDAVEGEPIHMQVLRDLRRDFSGFYRVTIRSFASNAVVCSTDRVNGSYLARGVSGEPTKLPDPLTLAWWAHGGGCTEILKQGLPPGSYAVETCHGIYNVAGYARPQERCWRPMATFQVIARQS